MEKWAQQNEQSPCFQHNEVVWAKITGFPWWPALITSTPTQQKGNYRVDFFADQTHAYVSHCKIAKYNTFRLEIDLHKSIKKTLRKAIASADRYIGECSIVSCGTNQSSGEVEVEVGLQKQLCETPFIKQNLNEIKENKNEIKENKKQNRVIMKNQEMTYDQRQKYFASLLEKYLLNNIDAISNENGQKLQKISKIHNKNKTKYLEKSKNIANNCHLISQITSLTAKKINKVLKIKTKLPFSQRKIISLSLSHQICSQSEDYQNYIKQISKVYAWISFCSEQTILSYYKNWMNIDNQKDRCSALTASQ